jgi:tetratricopeptide (TPR) repeat protein
MKLPFYALRRYNLGSVNNDTFVIHPLKMNVYRVVFLTLITSLVFMGCSQFSTKRSAIGFHNFSARYNAYFMGSKDLEAAEYTMDSLFREDYNQLLPILMPLDSMLAMPARPLLKSAIKKASIVAEKHQNSKWVDNSYYILGKSRLYLGEWADGLEALRFVYANGRDENDKNNALILLMRAYTYRKDYSNAFGVAEYLSQQPLPKQLLRDFYLTKANLHEQNGEYLTSVAILEETFPLLKKSKSTARMHFAAGQMYDRLGQYALANKHYRSVMKNRPDYDLAFYSSMNSLQNRVFLNPKTDLSHVGFDRMLNDRKNMDLKDRVYYTMGLLEEHRKNLPGAVDYLKKAAAVSTGKGGVQKAYTYLQLARIHYDGMEKFDLAKAYYDSALIVLPKDAPEYKLVSERKRALDAFVTQFSTVRNEDSLQKLAKMNPLALDNKIDAIIEAQERERVAIEKKAKELAAIKSPAAAAATPMLNFGNDRRWELYDPALVSIGKIEFKRVWGSRALEDDWRRSSKQTRMLAARDQEKQDTTTGTQGAADMSLAKGSVMWNTMHAELKKNIPLEDSSFTKSLGRQEEALYNLGKIYRFDLKEPARALVTFQRVLNDFPNTKYKDEIYYLMYLSLSENEAKSAVWRDKLIKEFPSSTYARLVGKSGENTSQGGTDALKAYEKVYNLYANGDAPTALENVEADLPSYKGTELEDKFALLRVFLIGKVRGKEPYAQAISEFIRLYPSSPYLPRLKEMQDLSVLTIGKR